MSELAFELKLKAPACSPSIGAADFCSLTAHVPELIGSLSPKAQSSLFAQTYPSPRSAFSLRWSKLGRRSSAAILGCCVEHA